MTSPQRPYDSQRWRRMRIAVLVRYNYQCQLGLARCTGRADSVDHSIDWRDYPDSAFDMTNLRATCRSCNTAQRNARVAARARAQRDGTRRQGQYREW
jgi:5-methylcytosine-specific restriction endonuclease McrA